MYICVYIYIYISIDRYIRPYRQTDRQTDGRTDRRTDRQIDRHIHTRYNWGQSITLTVWTNMQYTHITTEDTWFELDWEAPPSRGRMFLPWRFVRYSLQQRCSKGVENYGFITGLLRVYWEFMEFIGDLSRVYWLPTASNQGFGSHHWGFTFGVASLEQSL